MNMNEIKSDVINIIKENIDWNYPININDNFEKDLLIDDIDKIGIIMDCENEFDIHIEDEEIDSVIIVSDLVQLINNKVNNVR